MIGNRFLNEAAFFCLLCFIPCMKGVITILILFIVTIPACQKKGLPTMMTRTREPARPVTIIDVKPDTALGKMIFMNRCNRCHALPAPDQFTAQRWDGILSIMIPRARLDNPQKIHVTSFIKANCIR
jgi:hypothetical protein